MNEENTEPKTDNLDPITEESQKLAELFKFIDEKIRPSLNMDGGDIVIQGTNKLANNNYEILVQLVGACSSCPSSTFTMQMGIERALKQNFAWVQNVTQV